MVTTAICEKARRLAMTTTCSALEIERAFRVLGYRPSDRAFMSSYRRLTMLGLDASGHAVVVDAEKAETDR